MKVIERDLHTTSYLVNLSVSSFMVTMAVMVNIWKTFVFLYIFKIERNMNGHKFLK